MREAQFIRQRRPAWERVEDLLARNARAFRHLSGYEIEELGQKYRALTSDLAYAQGHRFGPELIQYLNRLTARAHALVYRSDHETGWSRIKRFFVQTFPAEVRAGIVPIALCAALTVASAVLAYALIGADPDRALALLPDGIIPERIQRSLHDSNFAFSPQDSSAMSALIITNNVRVAFLAFGGGMTLGIVTLWIVLTNGVMLGGMAVLFTKAGFGQDFWATIAPHGVIELTAIQIAAAAGLILAGAVLFPGRLRRADALRIAGRRAGILGAGVGAMLVVAGTIEGFISPLRFSPYVRIAVGILTGIAMLAYFSLSGRARPAPLTIDRDV